MKKRSAKNKGNRFENYLVERLKEIDMHAKRNVASGAGLDKGDIYCPTLNIIIEAKNQKTVTVTKDFAQLEDEVFGNNTGVLMLRNPKQAEFKQTFVVMDLEDWLGLQKRLLTTGQVKDIQEHCSKPSRELQYATRVLEVAAKKVISMFFS